MCEMCVGQFSDPTRASLCHVGGAAAAQRTRRRAGVQASIACCFFSVGGKGNCTVLAGALIRLDRICGIPMTAAPPAARSWRIALATHATVTPALHQHGMPV